jgi:hypothetical protein
VKTSLIKKSSKTVGTKQGRESSGKEAKGTNHVGTEDNNDEKFLTSPGES